MQCPVDQEDLSVMVRVTGDAHHCEACGGLWLTREAMRSLGAWLPKGATPTEVDDARACAGCETAMDRVVIGELEIDVCGQCHAIWFDAGELAELKRIRAERAAAVAAPVETGPFSSDGDVVDTVIDVGSVVVDVVDLAASILSIFD